MLHPLRTIVAGVASLDAPDPLLPHAAETARALGAALHVVHAFDAPADGDGPPSAHAAALRARLEARVRADAPGAAAVCHVVEGAATDRLPEVAHAVGAELLVVGATRRNRIWRHFLGTTAEGVVRGAAVPVLVQRSSLGRGPRRVLLATDLSGAGAEVHERGLDVAGALCPGCAPELRSLRVVEDGAAPSPLPRAAREAAAQRELDAFVRGRRPRARGVQCKVRVGAAADEILAEASEWGVDLVVLGTGARGGADRFHLGSTAGAALRGAPCNVLAVPPAPRPEQTPATPGAEALAAPLPAA
jgi:nucleotide-binding universal stress UspA family protein